MNLNDLAIVFGLCTSLATGGGIAGKYYLDNEYVSSDALQQYELRGLKRDARKLKRRVDDGDMEYEDDYLDLLDEIDDLEEQL